MCAILSLPVQSNRPVIVECKQYHPTIENIEQLRHYLERLHKETKQRSRGILVHGGARKLRKEVRVEANKKPKVELIRYSVEVDFMSSK